MINDFATLTKGYHRRVMDDRIGWTLAQSGRAAGGLIARSCLANGLKPAQLQVLLLLSQHGPVSQQRLIEALGVDPSVLVTLLNDLEGAGLALRRRDPHDRRRHIVESTADGDAALARVDRAVDGYERELLADLSEAEVAQLGGLLARLRSVENICSGPESDEC
jgi:DNA-binding MarR family transcriptional regulator